MSIMTSAQIIDELTEKVKQQSDYIDNQTIAIKQLQTQLSDTRKQLAQSQATVKALALQIDDSPTAPYNGAYDTMDDM